MTKPEPVPAPVGPSTLIVTTAGRILAAMLAMDPGGRATVPTGAGGRVVSPLSPRLTRNAPAIPPKRAATMAIATAPATMAEIAPALRRWVPVGLGLL